MDGAAVRGSIDSNKNIWVVNSGGGIYRRNGVLGSWSGIPGSANDIAARNRRVIHSGSGTLDSNGGRGFWMTSDDYNWER